MDITCLCVAIMYDPIFAFLSIPLVVAHDSNQTRTTILVVAALAALYSYTSPTRNYLAPVDMVAGQENAETGQRCLMFSFRIALVLSVLMLIAGMNKGKTTISLQRMLE